MLSIPRAQMQRGATEGLKPGASGPYRARMARASRRKKKKPRLMDRAASGLRRVFRWAFLGLAGASVLLLLWIALYRFVDPPGGIYMLQEYRRLGAIQHEWADMDDIAPAMAQSVVAAEDVNFCRHWGFDVEAIRIALAEGAGRGASTISQQVVKNVFLWQGRNWVRKALEAVITPVMELIWPKRRILEVYLNIAEFDEGVFGVQAAAQHHFNRDADGLNAQQAALLAAVLPSPQSRDAGDPTGQLVRRANAILDGAATIARDDRGACFAR